MTCTRPVSGSKHLAAIGPILAIVLIAWMAAPVAGADEFRISSPCMYDSGEAIVPMVDSAPAEFVLLDYVYGGGYEGDGDGGLELHLYDTLTSDSPVIAGEIPDDMSVHIWFQQESVTPHGDPLEVVELNHISEDFAYTHSMFDVTGTWRVALWTGTEYVMLENGSYEFSGQWFPGQRPAYHPSARFTGTMTADPGIIDPGYGLGPFDMSVWMFSIEGWFSQENQLFSWQVTGTPAPDEVVPEPATVVLFGAGVGLLALRGRRRRSA
jgi:hypothetical protein